MEKLKGEKGIIRGISVANPDDIERAYMEKVVDYAIAHDYDHFQFIGPIHNPVRGNIDGMILNKKYAKFNYERDEEYVKLNLSVVNDALDKLNKAGIKSYMWHHELDLPADFSKEYPEICNENGDVEVTHPLIKDYLETRIAEFFEAYPKMDGIILTLHETKIPLLKLKNQKLDKIGRVKYVTEILYKACKERGKELVVRPFASVPEDYDMMLKAYESIAKDLVVMDKWTQFDWSLTLPHNQFFKQIKNNPLFVETDIFGEYFGKGRLPIMLKQHIIDKVKYCQEFSPIGYVNRIDREGYHPFGTVNEVNLEIMHALMSGEDVEKAIDDFFNKEYAGASEEVKDVMARTEEINRKLLNNNNYYFMEGSFFPELNHSKNHFYFEMFKKNCEIYSKEWFIPKNWVRGEIADIIAEKDEVVSLSTELLARVEKLNGKIDKARFNSLLWQFRNLYYAARAWRKFVDILIDYVNYFEVDSSFEKKLYQDIEEIRAIDLEGRNLIGDTPDYHLNNNMFFGGKVTHTVEQLTSEVIESFKAEKAELESREKDYVDYVACGGAMEGHRLMKEVNFSDTMLIKGRLCRIPGNKRGAEWSQINGHGWFSYEVKVKPNAKNQIVVELGSLTENLDVMISVLDLDKTFTVKEKSPNGVKAFTFEFDNATDKQSVRVRIDRISPYTPQIYSIKIK